MTFILNIDKKAMLGRTRNFFVKLAFQKLNPTPKFQKYRSLIQSRNFDDDHIEIPILNN